MGMADFFRTRRGLRINRLRTLAVGALLALAGCGIEPDRTLPNEATDPLPSDDYRLIARLVHLADPQIVDEESPARLPFALDYIPAAWRPQERFSTQVLDGIVRAINRYHEHQARVDFVICAGDLTDNAQWNELRWFLDVFDGGPIDPRSGPDDRPADQRGDPLLDGHAPFQARGLYRRGVHGDQPSISWYTVVGNHDRFALGIFPIIFEHVRNGFAPLPLPSRSGLILPDYLDPLAHITYALISPANPGPPIPSLPIRIPANSDRRFFTTPEFVAAHFQTVTEPSGHGLRPGSAATWYSTAPVPGLRLVVLDSCTPPAPIPAGFYSEGAITREQAAFLERELRDACQRSELAIVVTHHPSSAFQWIYGSAATPKSFREVLNRHPCVVAHLTGHGHRHQVWDRGGYVEIETSSTLDFPQEGRFLEVWRRNDDVLLRYWTFSHLDPDGPRLDPDGDPLFRMREVAFELASQDRRVGSD